MCKTLYWNLQQCYQSKLASAVPLMKNPREQSTEELYYFILLQDPCQKGSLFSSKALC